MYTHIDNLVLRRPLPTFRINSRQVEFNDNLVLRRPLPTFRINSRQVEFNRKHARYSNAVTSYHEDTEMLCRLLDVTAGKRILETGGGVGFNLFELANLGAHCLDVDICPGNPQFVSALADFYNLNVVALAGDTCDLPFDDESFDAVYSKDTFEHIWDPNRAPREQLRVLRRGGRLCILVGNLANPKTFYDTFVRRFFASGGREGGPAWLLNKGRAVRDFGVGWHGKDEDFKTIWWWKRTLHGLEGLVPVEITTSRAYKYPHRPVVRLLKPFAGGIVILAVKE